MAGECTPLITDDKAAGRCSLHLACSTWRIAGSPPQLSYTVHSRKLVRNFEQ